MFSPFTPVFTYPSDHHFSSLRQLRDFGAPVTGYFRLEWTVEEGRSGRPAVVGYIHNANDFWASGLHLLVEELSSSGAPVSQTVGYVDSDVPPGGRAYFEVRVPKPDAAYRATV